MKNYNDLRLSVVLLVGINFLPIEHSSCDPRSKPDIIKCQKDAEGFCPSKGKMDQISCALTPSSDEGPFFLPNMPVRSDVTEGKPGVPLTIEFTVKDVKTCKPVKSASVHIWQADALGFYSAYLGYYPLGDPQSKRITGKRSPPTEKATFLRGIQNSDENGKVTFKTVYPGWYLFRALHIHFKVTTDGDISRYTGEIFFPDELTAEVAKVEPYTKNTGKRVLNREDWQFVNEHGDQTLVHPKGNTQDGLLVRADLIIDLNAIND